MRRRFASLLLAAMLTLTAVAEDLGEPIPEVEPAAEEIYEETEMATESEDPEEDDAGTEETISTTETTAEDVETTEEVSESEEVDGRELCETEIVTDTEAEKHDGIDADGTIETGSESERTNPEDLNRDDGEVNEETCDDDFAEESEEETEEVIVVESEPIVIESEPIVIGETESEVIEEPEVIEEEIEMPMMMMAMPMMLGASKASTDVNPDTSKGRNSKLGYDYAMNGSKYKDDDVRRYGFYYGTDYSYKVEGLYRTELYKEDATNTDVIRFYPNIPDKKTEFSMYVNGQSVESQGWIGALFSGEKEYFEITYADLYKALDNGSCTVTIHCRENAGALYTWMEYKNGWSVTWEWIRKDVDKTWTFTKHDYSKDFSNDTHSVSLTSDKTECYPGDTVIFTASATALRESTNVNDQYTISYTYVVNGTEYKNEGTVFMYTAGTETITCYVVAYFTPKTSS